PRIGGADRRRSAAACSAGGAAALASRSNSSQGDRSEALAAVRTRAGAAALIRGEIGGVLSAPAARPAPAIDRLTLRTRSHASTIAVGVGQAIALPVRGRGGKSGLPGHGAR